MISPAELEEKLVAFVQLKGMGTERERVGIATVRQIAPEIHRLIRGEVIQAKREVLPKE